ncbi:acyl carrier protein [Aestuariibacter sp. A3R04]|uniref:acyl carrier protein n=1 Tax=Aestuariibacter sp. A3R04 TaxID=2841571 RepID=UPI001C080F67|nr:acyl carrier protein [Aestuariibacter sp. A3R04]
MDNQQKLVQSFVQALGVEEGQVTDQLTYNTIKEWDSTAHMILISEIENTFDVMLDTDDIIDMSTVAKAKEILANYDISF